MVKIVTFESGEKVVRDALPDEIRVPATSEELDAIATEFVENTLEQDRKMKALAGVMADLAVASGIAADLPSARQQVKNRFRNYYRALLG